MAGLTGCYSQNPMPTEDVKALRVSIDSLLKEIHRLQGFANVNFQLGHLASGQVETKLMEAKMWCGKILEANNSPLPQEFRDEAKQE